MKVLAFESSCDDTGVAIFDTEVGLQADRLYSQTALHAQYGGVVPELASRDHIQKTLPLLKAALSDADCSLEEIDGIAYTSGPGLAGALLVGACIGRSLAYSVGVPAIAVHHLEGHLLAPMLSTPKPEFPFVALLISGGHTLLMSVEGLGQYTLLGETLDDAAGEAFDKTARLLGLPYPGGKALADLATKGTPARFIFPRPLLRQKELNFSFSGLKTFAVNTWQKSAQDDETRADIAYAFEEAIIETVCTKCRWAIEKTGHPRLVISGGVGANQKLRATLANLGQAHGWETFFPEPRFCTDNAAMIAYAGSQWLLAGKQQGLAIEIHPRWPLA